GPWGTRSHRRPRARGCLRTARAGWLCAERRHGVAGAQLDRLRAGPAARRWPDRGVRRRARLRPGPVVPPRPRGRRRTRPPGRLARAVGQGRRGGGGAAGTPDPGEGSAGGVAVMAMTGQRLAGQRVVVAGGTSGMGRATARAAAALGAEVVAAG